MCVCVCVCVCVLDVCARLFSNGKERSDQDFVSKCSLRCILNLESHFLVMTDLILKIPSVLLPLDYCLPAAPLIVTNETQKLKGSFENTVFDIRFLVFLFKFDPFCIMDITCFGVLSFKFTKQGFRFFPLNSQNKVFEW